MAWVSDYGTPGLLPVAISPLPQTPALIFFGIVRGGHVSVPTAMRARKSLKYGLLARVPSRFPERFSNGIGGFVRHRRQASGPKS